MIEKMLIIKSIDPGAKLAYSEYTDKFYVDSDIYIGNGAVISGVSEHRAERHQAIDAFFARITHIDDNEYLVTEYLRKHRREWRWNGAAFAECTRQEVMK